MSSPTTFRARPNLERDEHRIGGTSAHAASAAGRTAQAAADEPASLGERMPRRGGRAMARARRLVRSARRLVPAATVVLVISLAAVIAIGLLPELRRRREGPVARLARRSSGLSSGLPTFDA